MPPRRPSLERGLQHPPLAPEPAPPRAPNTCAATGAIERRKIHAALANVFRVIANVFHSREHDTADLYPIERPPWYARRPR